MFCLYRVCSVVFKLRFVFFFFLFFVCFFFFQAEDGIRDFCLSRGLGDVYKRQGLIRMQNGHYMTGDGNHHRMVEVDMMGNTIHNWDMLERGYTMHHAISQDKQGNILATVSKTSAKIANGKDVRINDFIIMMDPEKGEILQEWDLVHMLDSARYGICLLYTSPSPRDRQKSRMPSSA